MNSGYAKPLSKLDSIKLGPQALQPSEGVEIKDGEYLAFRGSFGEYLAKHLYHRDKVFSTVKIKKFWNGIFRDEIKVVDKKVSSKDANFISLVEAIFLSGEY